MVEHHLDMVVVGGSIPLVPTNFMIHYLLLPSLGVVDADDALLLFLLLPVSLLKI